MLERGRYLVEAVGHCGECHTPRSKFGRLKKSHHLAGSDEAPHGGPNITSHRDGLQKWSDDDLASFLQYGMTPEGDFVGSGMSKVVSEGTSKLPNADLKAIVAYLRWVEPLPTVP